MAGGEFAAELPCSECAQARKLSRAWRTYDGSETDWYECEEGHKFGIHWRQLPTEPLWPPSAADRALLGGGDGKAG
jgi:hypothetical protein